MIDITYNREEHRLAVTGHGGEEHGKDLVCAAVSILVCTLAEDLERICNAQPEKYRHTKIRLEPGDAEIDISPLRYKDSNSTFVFDAICTGFELLSKAYPDKINYYRA